MGADLKSRLTATGDGRTKRLDKIKKLQETKRKVGIFGAGVYARLISEMLQGYGVSVDFCVVDDEYVSSANRWGGIPVYALSYVKKQFDGAIMIPGINILGFDDWDIFVNDLHSKMSVNQDILDIGDYGMGNHEDISKEYVQMHMDGFENTFAMLADERSRDVMAAYLNASIDHDVNYLKDLWTARGYDYEMELLFNGINDGAVIECGAFNGKTAVEMDEYLGGTHEIYALECDSKNYEELCNRVSDRLNIKPLKYAVWDKKTHLIITQKGSSCIVEELGQEGADTCAVNAVSIDSLSSHTLAAIVMDVEGSEMRAIHGARTAIAKDRPKLAVRVYHRAEDLFIIPQAIKKLNENYRLYLRYNYQGLKSGIETTLYAV